MLFKISNKIINRIIYVYSRFQEFFCTFYCKLILLIRGINYGKNVRFIGRAYFYKNPTSDISIGDNVTFRSDEYSNLIGVTKKCIISTLSENSKIVIGNNCGFSGVTIGAANNIILGNNVMIGANCVITDTNWHDISPFKRNLIDQRPGTTRIENNVFIGYGAIILKNVTIGENSVIGAGSVVTNNIPPNVIASGNPCVVIKKINLSQENK